MLDTATKTRINTARDILVGKVPDPKSQVEQITIALIYKFMDDMDAESEEIGGKRTFFTGKFSKYGWRKIFDPKLSGFDMLNLYSEAIQQMNLIPTIPQLFRDIFKNAYLPYRDPETLKAFLKIINEFSYDHSEKLGDAFEYLLSVLGSQGDAGQFRTPRHIIDFMVRVTDPKKNEKILDPACGTAGFLISSYKHILLQNSKGGVTGRALTNDDRKKLAANFRGYDISPDMVRLSLANMYLHGFTQPQIYEYDTLTCEDRWNEYYDVIMANPPFMSPKGGIRPHKRFSVQSNRSEVLFVDYMVEHLTPNGRAAIIVPEGIIFQSGTAYKQLRKLLVEQYLYAVVSLPAGVFNPYSGVKTSVLLIDKAIAKKSDSILFVKIQNDGFDLGAHRRAIDKSDLYFAEELLKYYRQHTDLASFDEEEAKHLATVQNKKDHEANDEIPLVKIEAAQYLHIPKEKIAANGEYNFSGERYKQVVLDTSSYETVQCGTLMRANVKSFDPRLKPEDKYELWSIPAFDNGAPEILCGSEIGSAKKVVIPEDVLLSRIVPHIRRSWVVKEINSNVLKLASTEWIVFNSDKVVPGYLKRILTSDPFHSQFMLTVTGVGGSLSRANPKAVGEISIPLPPLLIQQQIVFEIESYQKIIDGAKQVVDNYKPNIRIHPDWPMVELGEVCETSSGGTPLKSKLEYYENGNIPWIRSGEVAQGFIYHSEEFITKSGLENSSAKIFPINSVLIAMYGATAGEVGVLKINATTNQAVCAILPNEKYLPEFLYYFLLQIKDALINLASGGAQPNISQKIIREIKIPLPHLIDQQAIVHELEMERLLVQGNQQLILRMQQKIKDTIAQVWGAEQSNTVKYEENDKLTMAAEE